MHLNCHKIEKQNDFVNGIRKFQYKKKQQLLGFET